MKRIAAMLPALVSAAALADPAAPLRVPLTVHAETALGRFFVELQTPSVAALTAQALRNRTAVPDRGAQRRHAAELDEQQRMLLPFVAAIADRVDGRLRVALNGFKVTAGRDQVDALRTLPGVRRVVPLRLHDMSLAGSVPWVGAPAAWPQGSGKGVRIAIIDTGIDYTHRNFGGSGDTLDFLLNDPAEVEPGTFPTEKVVAGFDFAGPVYNARDPDSVPDPDPDPIDRHGHGTHVAGIAAGFGVGEHLGAGMAPGASLLALKVFSDEGGSTDLVTDAIDMALDPDGDGAIDDRVDVINMSLGSAFGDPADPSAVAARNAVDNGVIVVASAGNRADVPYVTGSPAVAPGVISVAASWPGNRVHPALAVTGHPVVEGLHEAREGLGPVSLAMQPVAGEVVDAAGPADDGDGNPLAGVTDNLACHPLDDPATDRIVLVGRGNCSFTTKYANVQANGAAAIVVYNDGSSPGRIGPQTMTGIDDDIAIPGMMISHPSGVALRDTLLDGKPLLAAMSPTLTVPADPVDDDTLAWFTSRGPGHGGSLFKPDLTAPGYGIVSSDAGSGTGARVLNGTSMAAPHVAGAAALLRQRYPQLAPAAIRGLLAGSTVDANRNGPASDSPYPLTRQGTGVLRLDRAIDQTAYASPAGVSFGRLEVFRPLARTVTTTLTNLGDETRVYQVSHRPNQQLDGVNVACPGEVEVEAGAGVPVTIRLAADPDALPYERAGQSQTEVDGWCIFDDGTRTVRVGYLAVIDPVSMLRAGPVADGQVRLENFGPARGVAEPFLLAAALPLATAKDAAVAAFGVRPVDYGGFPLIHFGFSLWRPWENPAHLSISIYIDNDEDGREDFLLRIADWSAFGGTTGSLVTLQIPLDDEGEPDFDNGFLDWLFSSADYNDQVMYAPFTQVTAGDGDVFLDPGDTRFGWRLVVSARDGSESEQSGVVDLSNYAEQAAVTLDAGAATSLDASAEPMLWLYPANPVGRQFQVLQP